MAEILQIAYYPGLLQSRQIMLEQEGHQVISALGNEQGIALAGSGQFDVVVIGFSSGTSTRDAMVRWLKQHVPQTPVVVLLGNSSEHFPDADRETLSENPRVWLNAVARAVRAAG